MSEIPIKIGTHIGSLVSFQGDLASLCLVSPSWLETSRPFLYRKLKINYGSSTLKDTMLMLNKNKLLKLNVKSLHLDGNGVPPTEEFTAEWNKNVNLDGMEKIRSLYISGFHWTTSPDSFQQNPMILQLLSQIRIPLLDEFKISIYTPISQPVRPVTEFLAAHPSLRHFSISSNDVLYFDETSPKDILPNLISLSTNYFVFIEMYGVFFSGNHLTSLEFNSELPFHMEQKERGMAEAGLLGKLVGQHPIKRLSHYKTWQKRARLVARVLKNLGYVAPSIEHISLLELHSLDNKADRAKLIEALNAFPKLHRLDLQSVGLSQRQIILLAQEITTLQRIYIFPKDSRKEGIILERVGGPVQSSSFEILDMKECDI